MVTIWKGFRTDVVVFGCHSVENGDDKCEPIKVRAINYISCWVGKHFHSSKERENLPHVIFFSTWSFSLFS